MRAEVRINMDNAAFENGDSVELARILRKIADSIQQNGTDVNHPVALRDINGNSVGFFMVVDEEYHLQGMG